MRSSIGTGSARASRRCARVRRRQVRPPAEAARRAPQPPLLPARPGSVASAASVTRVAPCLSKSLCLLRADQRAAGHGEHFAALLEREARRYQRARSPGRFHHHDADRKSRDEPVAAKEIAARGSQPSPGGRSDLRRPTSFSCRTAPIRARRHGPGRDQRRQPRSRPQARPRASRATSARHRPANPPPCICGGRQGGTGEDHFIPRSGRAVRRHARGQVGTEAYPAAGLAHCATTSSRSSAPYRSA